MFLLLYKNRTMYGIEIYFVVDLHELSKFKVPTLHKVLIVDIEN